MKNYLMRLPVLCVCLLSLRAVATTYYVDINSPNPTPPYTSWSTAATNIQDAIDASIIGDTIIVTDGVYQVGGETVDGSSLTNRVVINKNITVQSVNGPSNTIIEGNQLPTTMIYVPNQNAYPLSPDGPGAVRCVCITTNAALIGFTLTDGATVEYDTNGTNGENGGGVWCAFTNGILISNCVITANAAFVQGGGAFQGTLANCTVLGNQATEGGGIANALVFRSLIISNAVTIASGALGEGGGVYESSVFSSAIAENSAANYGGGAFGGSLVNCTVTGNSALEDGGGTASCAATNSIIYYNRIYSNIGDTNYIPEGYFQGGSLNYCCSTPNAGGANITAPPILADISHISLNSSCRGAGNPLVTSGVDIDSNPWVNPPSIGCSEIPPGGDYGNLIVNISTPFTNWAPGYSLNFQATISGPCYTTVWNFGDGTIVTNAPYLSHIWSPAGNYPVTLTAYNDSYPNGVTETQMINITVPTTYYVNWANLNPVPPYSYWSTAATNIQDAVSVAAPGSLVLVTNPTVVVRNASDQSMTTNSIAVYQYGGATAPNHSAYRVVITNAITLESVNGPATTYIFGITPSGGFDCIYLTKGATLIGFSLTNSSSYSYSGQVWAVSTNVVITNCIFKHYLTVNSGTLDYCSFIGTSSCSNSTLNNCLFAGSSYSVDSRLNSCTVSNDSDVLGGILNNCVLINNTNSPATASQGHPLVLNDCLISNNTSQYGGGVYNSFFSVQNQTNCILNNCILTRNSAQHYGGGAYGAELNNCLISSNQAYFGGGGVEGGLLNNCSLINNSTIGGSGGGADGIMTPFILNNCTLTGNVAGSGGAASANSPDWGYLNQCIVSNNAAEESGGVAGCTLTNCLIAYNVATDRCGGAADSTLVNCTVAYNSAQTTGGILDGSAANCILYYNVGGDYGTQDTPTRYDINFCCTAILPSMADGNLETTVGNFTNAPIVVNLAGGDFHLQSSSPCINSGNNAYVSSATDLDGNPRIVGGTVDIGAYEYQTPTSVISYAYLQQYGLPTDGSVDFADLDGTAFNVYQDWIAGLNPTNPASVLAMQTPVATNNASGVTVTWQSVSGIPYFLQRSTNLTLQPTFSIIQNNIIGQAGTTSYTDSSATNNVPYFYRVGVVGP